MLRRWSQREVAHAWAAWEARLAERAVQARAGVLMLGLQSGRAFRRWEAMADNRVRLREVAQKVMRRMLSRLQARNHPIP
jgi:hypothetical protein